MSSIELLLSDSATCSGLYDPGALPSICRLSLNTGSSPVSMASGLLHAPAGVRSCNCRHNGVRTACVQASANVRAHVQVDSGARRLAGEQLRSGAYQLRFGAYHRRLENVRQFASSPRCQATSEKKTVTITGTAAAVRKQPATLLDMTSKCFGSGATGLIGSRLAARLSSQGHTVRVLTRNVNKARNKLQYARLQFYSTQQLQEAVKGADAVINLAGLASNLSESSVPSADCRAS